MPRSARLLVSFRHPLAYLPTIPRAQAHTQGASFTRAQWSDSILSELVGLQLPCFNIASDASAAAASTSTVTSSPQVGDFLTALARFTLNDETAARYALPPPAAALQVPFAVAESAALAATPALQALLAAARAGHAPAECFSIAFQRRHTLAVLLEDAAGAFSAHALLASLRARIYSMLPPNAGGQKVLIAERSLDFPDRTQPSSIVDAVRTVEAPAPLGADCTLVACHAAAASADARLSALLAVLFSGDAVAFGAAKAYEGGAPAGRLSAAATAALKQHLAALPSDESRAFVLATLVAQAALAHDGARLTEAVNTKRYGKGGDAGAKKKKKEAEVNVREVARALGCLNLSLHDQVIAAAATAFVQAAVPSAAPHVTHVRTDVLALRGVLALAAECVQLANAFAAFPLPARAASALSSAIDGDAFFDAFARLRKDVRAVPAAAEAFAAVQAAVRACAATLGANDEASHVTEKKLEAGSDAQEVRVKGEKANSRKS